MLITAVLTVATSGVGSSAAVEGLGMTAGSVSATMTATAVNGLVVQASTSLIANGGDIGKVIKELSSTDSIKSLATNVATAGLTNGISNQLGFEHKDVAKLSLKDHLRQAAQEHAIEGAARIAAGSAIKGGNVAENLVDPIRSAAVDTAAEGVAHGIGNLYHGDSSKAETPTAAASTSTASTSTSQTASKLDPVTHKIVHGGLGAAAAAAKGQSALAGAIIGETVAEFAAKQAVEKASVRAAKGAQDEAIQCIAETGRPLTKEEFESIYQKHLTSDFKSELQKASRIGQVADATGGFVIGQDPTAALGTAKTATENNFEINMPPEVAEAAVGQIEAAWEESKSNPKFRGKVNVALGVASLATGGTSGLIAAPGESVVGGIAVATGAAIAVDQIATGAMMMYTGTDQPSTFDQGLPPPGMPECARIATLGVVGMFEPGSFPGKRILSLDFIVTRTLSLSVTCLVRKAKAHF